MKPQLIVVIIFFAVIFICGTIFVALPSSQNPLKGSLEVISPDPGMNVTSEEPPDEIYGAVFVPIAINSTYKEPVSVNVSLNGVFAYTCVINPNGLTECMPLPITRSGTNLIEVSDPQHDTNLKTTFTWDPPSEMDITALSVAEAFGMNNTDSGYLIMIAAIIVIPTLILAIFGGTITKSPQGLTSGGIIGAIIGFFLLILANFQVAGEEGTAALNKLIVGGIVLFIVIAILFFATKLNLGVTKAKSYRGDEITTVGLGERASLGALPSNHPSPMPQTTQYIESRAGSGITTTTRTLPDRILGKPGRTE